MKTSLRSPPLVEESGEVIQIMEHRPTLNLTLTSVVTIQGLSECVCVCVSTGKGSCGSKGRKHSHFDANADESRLVLRGLHASAGCLLA